MKEEKKRKALSFCYRLPRNFVWLGQVIKLLNFVCQLHNCYASLIQLFVPRRDLSICVFCFILVL